MSAPAPTRHRRPGPAFRERPTREQIAELPPFDPLPLERIVVVETAEQAEAALRAMTRARFVGFDTESKPTFTRDAVRDGPHVIQFATAEQGFIVQVNDRTPIAFLREVLESEAIVKVGFGLDSDRGPLEHKLHTRLRASVEVSQVLRSLGHKQALGAKAAVAVVLGRRLTKSKSVTTSNWGAARLTPQQLLYAANDAYAALKVFEAMGSPYP
jgi:ribonuclease D